MSALRLATPEEVANWDALVALNPSGGDVFQSKAFAAVKARHGWTPKFTIYYSPGVQHIATLYLTRRIPLIGELWYSPKGPDVISRGGLAEVLAANRAFAKGTRIFAFKLDPEVPKELGYPDELVKAHNVQPNASTVIVDLTPDEPTILASFRQRARRAIRQAEAAGVHIKPVKATPGDMRTMYDLYNSTGQRAGFHVRDFSYHQKLWQLWVEAGQGQLFFAYQDERVIAGAFVAYLGKKALYKDGASDRGALSSGAAHLLQWHIMRWLKAHGKTSYDLHGTPPAEELDNKAHRFYGLGLFKTSFANNLTEYIGTVDQVIDRAAYRRWRKGGDRLAQTLEYRLRGRTFY